MRIGVRDGGSPPRIATATVTLTVDVYRDQFTPQFINVATYPRTISENSIVGSSITRVTATDDDRVVSHTFRLDWINFLAIFVLSEIVTMPVDYLYFASR